MDKKLKAKHVKIEDLYEGELRQVGGNKLGGLCPFHKDTNKANNNFVVYTMTNTYYCFVCRKGGDSITFIMNLKDLDFKDAMKELLKKA